MRFFFFFSYSEWAPGSVPSAERALDGTEGTPFKDVRGPH